MVRTLAFTIWGIARGRIWTLHGDAASPRYRPIANDSRGEWFLRCLMYRVFLSWYSLWRPTSPPTMVHLTTCKYSNFSDFLWFLIVRLLIVPSSKVSNAVHPRRGEILQRISGQSWCYSSDWRSYHPRWFGVPEVLHFSHSRSWISCCRSLNPDFRQKCHIAPKNSVLEEGSQLHIRRLQFPHVDRIHRHNSTPPHFFFPPSQIYSSFRPLAFLQASWGAWPTSI